MAAIQLDDSETLLGSDVDEVDSIELLGHIDRTKKSKRKRKFGILVGVSLFILIIIFLVRLPGSKNLPGLELPVVTHLEPQFFPEHKSERVQIKYGPFTVPGSGHHNGMKNFKTKEAKAPCQGCLITWMHAGLEYLDGSYANAHTDMWLHHTVLQNNAQLGHGSCKKMRRERFFASGNERSVVDLTLNGTEKFGYWFGEDDTASMGTELMNAKTEPQTVILTVTYEYIPYRPHDFQVAIPIWLDVGGCRSEVPVPEEEKSFELISPSWLSTISGRVITIVSHLHDGGDYLEVRRNDEMVCKSSSTYGMISEFEHHMPGMDMDHITVMSTCNDVGKMRLEEEWTVKARYDLSRHAPMLDAHGEPGGVMGIGVLYVVED